MTAVEDISTRYVEIRFEAVQREIDVLLSAHREVHLELQRAVDLSQETTMERTRVALEAIEARLNVLNEFRGSLEDSLKNNVSRDIFDIVVNRVTIVENTYVKKADYITDADRLRERFDDSLKQRDLRISELERNTVRQEALDSQANEVARTRKALTFTIIGGAALMALSLIVNAFQGGVNITP